MHRYPGLTLVNLAGASGPAIILVIAMGMAGYGLLRDALPPTSDSPLREAAIGDCADREYNSR